MSVDSSTPSPIFTALQKCDQPALVALINESPTWDTVDEIATTFPIVASTYPTDALKIAETINAASKSSDTPIAISDGKKKKKLNLIYELKISIIEFLKSAFSTENRPAAYTDIAPTNEFLVAALISGVCQRTGLCESPDQRGMVCEGLQIPGYNNTGRNDEWQQVYAIHGCLALLAGGSSMYATIQDIEADQLGPALKRIADEEIIKNENGKKLLQIAIQQVELGSAPELDIKTIWMALFPEA